MTYYLPYNHNKKILIIYDICLFMDLYMLITVYSIVLYMYLYITGSYSTFLYINYFLGLG